jgi:HK97 family phage portal protein
MNKTGVNVTERSALTLTAAYACINVISTDLASLPLKCYRKVKSGGRKETPDVPGAYLLQWSPDEDDTSATQFRRDWIAHALGWGNGFVKITRDGRGDPVRLDLLDPSKWVGDRRPDRRLYYCNKDTLDTEFASNVMHLAGVGFDGVTGYSPIKLAKQAVALGLAAETFGASFFGNGSTVSGWFTHPRTLKDGSAARLRQSIEAVHGGVSKAHRIGILEEGMSFVKTSVDPDDAQFLATRKFQAIEVCRLYRVPPHKIGDYSQSHLANVEASNLDYIISTLRPWAVALEMVASMRLLTPELRKAGYYFEHQLTALLRGDMKARAEYYQRMRDLGAITPDEIRDMESMNPWPDGIGKVPLVPAQLVPLKRMSEEPEPVPEPLATKPQEDKPPEEDQQSESEGDDNPEE